MSNQFPAGYGQTPPFSGYGQMPPGGTPARPSMTPGPPGQQAMYNGTNSTQQGPVGYGGMPTSKPSTGPAQNFGGPPLQNGPPMPGHGGPRGDMQAGGPRGPPGMTKPYSPNQFPPAVSGAPNTGQQYRGPLPGTQPGSGQGIPPPSVNQMAGQMGSLNMAGPPHAPGPMASTTGPPGGQPMGGMGPPRPGPPGGQPMGGMGPPHPGPPSGQPMSGMGPPRPGPPGGQPMGGMGSPHSGPPGGQPMGGMGPPHPGPPGGQQTSSVGPPTGTMGPPMNMIGSQNTNMPPQSTGMSPSFGMPPTNTRSPQPFMPISSPSGAPPGSLGNQPGMVSAHGMPMSQPTGFPPMPTSQGPSHSAGQFPPSSLSGPAQPQGPQYGQGAATSQPPGFPPMNAPPQMGVGNQGPPMGQFPQQQPGGQFPGSTTPTSAYQQPGYPGFGGAPGAQRMPAPMQQPQKKLDPDQMPSPIQVIEDDKRNRGGIFSTAGKGTVPPLVSTKFTCQDQGNCNPSFARATMYNIPCTGDMLKNSNIPLAMTIAPFAKLQPQENEPPLVDLGEMGPVRCKRCKAYMNPFMIYVDGGRRFQCVFCGAATEVPPEYFAHLDHTGRRIDWYQRPELSLGSYEFVATKDYCKNGVLPNAPAFIFMIDVSYSSVKSGLVHLICDRLRNEVLANLPKETGADESEIRVGFVTYAKEIHFYNVKGSLAQPQMMVVSDLEDVFVPLLDGFLVKLSDSDAVIESLLAQIPQMFADSRETETVLGPVIQAGLDALKSADRAGKLYIFHSTLPIAEAPGKLKNRDDRKLLGTEKEKTVLAPQNNFYTKLGQECVSAGCSVDLFLFPNAYLDVASIGEVCRLTGGNMYKYSYFQADLDGNRFMDDLRRNVENQRSFDAILRVRTSTGIRPVDFLGNFYMSNTTDVEMAAIDCDQAICVEIKHDDKLSEADGAFVQVAVLYTSVGGQRRLRVHNLSFNCCTQFADLFRACELDTLVNFMSKSAIRNILNTNPKHVREVVMNQVANVLACYRKNCASPSSAGQLILPECMKLLPLYGNCVVKSDGIQGGSEISTDDRSYLMHLMNSMDVKSSNVFLYPRLLPLHNLELDSHELSTPVRCSADRLQEDGVYLLENGVSMFMWIGHNVDPDWIQKVFGVQSAAQIDIDKCKLLELDNDLSHRVREVVKQIRSERNRHMKLTIVRQRDKLEPWFCHFLVEDKGLNGSASYVDFLCHIHKEIRNLLS
ncbi:hypothetical protein ScPMuIL_004620 [Solemya velum]